MFRKLMDALGDCGKNRTDDAIRPERMKITVVKKPNTFCARIKVECISFGLWLVK